MSAVTRLPFDPGPAVWNELLPAGDGHAALVNDVTADVLVIGAGFAGLTAARQLKLRDPKVSVAVMEARRIGEGPTGRNSGFMIDLPHNLASKDYAGEQNLDRLQTEMNRAAIDFAEAATRDYKMRPEAFVKSGKINAAATAKGHAHNLDYAQHLETLNEPYDVLDAKQMQDICGSQYYRSGVYTPGTAMLQPALYVRSLAEGLARDGVKVFENSPVTKLEQSSSGNSWTATSHKGSVHTGKVIIAANGHVESFGYFKRRLIHIYLYGSMTRQLSEDEIKRLGGEPNWGFTPADPMGTTMRRISGGHAGDRIIVRNSISWGPNRATSENKHQQYARTHDRSFTRRFPQLAGVDMEYRWGGLLCLSRNTVPAFGEVEDGIISACCQNGLGTAYGTISGMGAANFALGIKSPQVEFLQAHDEPEKLPPEPFAGLGANVVFKWGLFKAGREL